MSAVQNGGAAFPQHDLSGYGIGPSMVDGSDTFDVRGMSLRDWFAGQVIGSLISDPAVADAANLAREAPARIACIAAYEIADAMLAAREVSR